MLAKQRYDKIMELLDRDGIIHIAELVKLMNVSSETIRKSLKYLDNQGRLSRVHGDAVPLGTGKSPDIPGGYISFQIRNSQNLEQKAAVTAEAAALMDEGQVIALNYGSTGQMVALEFRERFRNLSMVTNSIQNALVLAEDPGITIILTGGILNRDECTLVDDFSSALKSIHIDITFTTVTGIDPAIGCTDQQLSEIRIQNQIHRCASRTVALADSSKFGKASLLKTYPFDKVDATVTDSGISPELESQIRRTGANLMIT